MAKLSVSLRNKKRQKLVDRFRVARAKLRSDAKNVKLSDEERDEARTALQKMPRDTSACRVRRRCQLTGRPRGVYKKFLLCRHSFRELAHRGLIPGVTKASW